MLLFLSFGFLFSAKSLDTFFAYNPTWLFYFCILQDTHTIDLNIHRRSMEYLSIDDQQSLREELRKSSIKSSLIWNTEIVGRFCILHYSNHALMIVGHYSIFFRRTPASRTNRHHICFTSAFNQSFFSVLIFDFSLLFGFFLFH